jgi:hypothetical protein
MRLKYTDLKVISTVKYSIFLLLILKELLNEIGFGVIRSEDNIKNNIRSPRSSRIYYSIFLHEGIIKYACHKTAMFLVI